MTIRRALVTFALWMGVAGLVNLAIWAHSGPQAASEFLGAYLIEEALSLDNMFMFYVIFSAFRTPDDVRRRVLNWGIVGVILMRGGIILGGTAIIHRFHALLWFFAFFLFWSAWKIFFHEEDEGTEEETQEKLESNWLVRLATRWFGFVHKYEGDHFFTTVGGKTRGTLLLLVLLVVEGTDVPFAFDSLPAAMAVSQNFFIVMSSNLLAVLGLRSIYFVIDRMQDRFSHMQQGIGLLLAIAGAKILLPDLGLLVNGTVGLVYPDIAKTIPPEFGWNVPLPVAIGTIAVIICVTIAFTLYTTRRQERAASES